MKARIINAVSERHRLQIEALASILELDEVEYEDRGNGENYLLRKNGKQVTLEVRGNREGGFLCIPEANLPKTHMR